MNTSFEDQVRDVLRDAPEPDWAALRAAVEDRAEGKRRVRMLRGSVAGFAAAAAVAAITTGVAMAPLFEGDGAAPAGSTTSTVPDSTPFVPRVKHANGGYTMPMAFPDIAPKGDKAPAGLVRSTKGMGTQPAGADPGRNTMASAPCQYGSSAPQPQQWGTEGWTYQRAGRTDGAVRAGVTVAGWPTTTAITAMQQLDQNSGACTFDQHFRKVAWSGLSASEGNQFVVDESRIAEGKRYVAIRRVGDVTVDAWTSGSDEQAALATARRLVDDSVANLLASKVLDDPQPAEFAWTDGTSEGGPDKAQFILPDIAPSADVAGVKGLTRVDVSSDGPESIFPRSDLYTVPVLGAQVGDPVHPGSESVAGRVAFYARQSGANASLETSIVWHSFPDGKKAFDEIIANKGTARWLTAPTREAWSGHDEGTTFLAGQPGENGPQQIALRLEGNVLISVVAQGETQVQARTIATKLADEAAKNLASFGRGPDGRPGNGK
ncbi:hypothetical protein [Knoellia subterranea]|uniref:Uncharacterized protein n=1 Tax=Knoellia subterranea KCTC 19937 TaxID=1385521 RepID=A0A0A0JJK3_9MICO|nr:hypothetical protein [Knoellia subterranea]KGN37565.1 hypothetical protein N803_13445 [Knoellia subterranea KCTC 19937]